MYSNLKCKFNYFSGPRHCQRDDVAFLSKKIGHPRSSWKKNMAFHSPQALQKGSDMWWVCLQSRLVSTDRHLFSHMKTIYVSAGHDRINAGHQCIRGPLVIQNTETTLSPIFWPEIHSCASLVKVTHGTSAQSNQMCRFNHTEIWQVACPYRPKHGHWKDSKLNKTFVHFCHRTP